MRHLPALAQHTLASIWEQYAKEYLLKHPECFGRSHNKISNYYIFTNNTKSRTLKIKHKNSTRNYITHSMAGLVFSYEIFRSITSSFFRLAAPAIIQGEALHIPGINKICVVRVERDFTKTKQLKVDWGKTAKTPKVWSESKQKMVASKLIYHTADDWCRIAWFRPGVTNDNLYEFRPSEPSSGGKKGGFTGELNRQLEKDKLLKFRYLFQPIRSTEDIRQKQANRVKLYNRSKKVS